jgi:VIT1/CCC1 family predicted Fe2+/Mn2+ transporter
MTADDLRRWRSNLQGEIDSAHIYVAMAANAGDERLEAVYREVAKAEERHAALWRQRLEEAGASTALAPSWRARAMAGIARAFGASLIAPTMAAGERRARTMYDGQPEAVGTSLPADQRAHASELHRITGGLSGAMLSHYGARHRPVGGNALRAAVLGANDGLVSNFSLVMGVAGASGAAEPVVIAGIAGLIAGSLSMALGEWLSVQSSRELYRNQIEVERAELDAFPAEEEEELRLLYEAKGLPEAEARMLAERIMAGDREVALDVMAREELGVDPDELGGSAWVAAFTSFFLFGTGAFIPLVPFLVTSGQAAIVAAAILSAIGLFALGAAITLLTGRNAIRSGLRQVAFGLAAAAVTFGIGSLLGTAIT